MNAAGIFGIKPSARREVPDLHSIKRLDRHDRS
jgi:hypothetical protein